MDKGKLVPGCAFYGYHTDANDDIIWNPKILYNSGVTCGNPGDNTTTVATKVNHCYTNRYSGVFIWELGEDVTSTNPSSLLNAIWDATSAKIITITIQPAATTTVIQGNISGSLSVAASTASSMGLSYQ